MLIFSLPGLAQLSLDLADTISFDSFGSPNNREEIGVTLTMGKLNLSSQATFAMERFQEASVMAKGAFGEVDFNVHTSFDQDGFKRGNFKTKLKAKGLSLEGVTTFGLEGLGQGKLKARLKLGQLALQSQASLQATTPTGLTTTISYGKDFGGYHLSSITRFNRLNFTAETLVLRVLMDNLALENSWLITSRGWTGDVFQVDSDLGMLHLASLTSWGSRGLEEGQLELRTVINDLRAKSTLRFNAEGFTSWSLLAGAALGDFDLKGTLSLTDKSFQGKLKASTTIDNVAFQSELKFTKAGLEKAILKAAAGIGIINLSSTLGFSPGGLSGEIKVEAIGLLYPENKDGHQISNPEKRVTDGACRG